MNSEDVYLITSKQLSIIMAWCKTGVIKNGNDVDNYYVVKNIFSSLKKFKEPKVDKND